MGGKVKHGAFMLFPMTDNDSGMTGQQQHSDRDQIDTCKMPIIKIYICFKNCVFKNHMQEALYKYKTSFF